MATFEEVYAINVNERTEKKGNLTYLSWAWAWAEFKKLYPNANYKVDKFDGNYCTGNEKLGYMVRTEVSANDLTYEMWLPVMDMRNNTILQPKMTEVNKTIMRCLTKNLAMFGLGLYIYAGEDLPESEEVEEQEKPQISNGNRANSHDTQKRELPITKAEMVEIWGIKEVEKTVAWFEGKIGKEMRNWNDEEIKYVRQKLSDKKREREEKAASLKAIQENDLPFKV